MVCTHDLEETTAARVSVKEELPGSKLGAQDTALWEGRVSAQGNLGTGADSTAGPPGEVQATPRVCWGEASCINM